MMKIDNLNEIYNRMDPMVPPEMQKLISHGGQRVDCSKKLHATNK